MSSVRINLVADLSRVMNVGRYSNRNKPVLLRTAANRYLQYSRKRFIALSAGGGEWRKLKRVTVLRKLQRGVADNPRAILREYDILLGAIDSKEVGDKIYIGIVRNRSHPRGGTIIKIAKIHTKGNSRLPARRVISGPNTSTLKKMVVDVRDSYNLLIRRQNRR